MTHKKKSYKLLRLSRPMLILGGVVVIVVIVITGLELTNTTHIFHKAPLAKIAVINSTSSQSKTSANKSKPTNTSSTSVGTPSAANSSSSSKDTSTGGGTSTSSTTLIAPYGDFVSTHTPRLGDTEVSVCNTTPSATCTITFTMGNTTRSLNTQTVDSNGSTSWTWVVDDSSNGFAAGNWQITVTATLNGQTKAVSDSRQFEVTQ